MISAARRLRRAVNLLTFSSPVEHVYNPLQYAWRAYEQYVVKYGATPKRVVFLGMNPGPFGMVQTGVPFGEVKAVRDWLKIVTGIRPPRLQHPRRPILGFDCPRSEISGLRLWGLFAKRFRTAEAFFADHFVLNYCPLAFLEETGRNRTPDKLPDSERAPLLAACDEHLRAAIKLLRPAWVIGIGQFAFGRAQKVLTGGDSQLGQVLHPSPANPTANRNWEKVVTGQLVELGVWP